MHDTPTHSQTLFLCLDDATHTHPHPHTFSLCYKDAHTHTLTLPPIHTHTNTLPASHTHTLPDFHLPNTQPLSLALSLSLLLFPPFDSQERVVSYHRCRHLAGGRKEIKYEASKSGHQRHLHLELTPDKSELSARWFNRRLQKSKENSPGFESNGVVLKGGNS